MELNMKKMLLTTILLMMMVILGCNQVYATENTAENIMDTQTQSELVKIKENAQNIRTI